MENNNLRSVEEALSKIPLSDTEESTIKEQIHSYFTNRVTITGLDGLDVGKSIGPDGLDVGNGTTTGLDVNKSIGLDGLDMGK